MADTPEPFEIVTETDGNRHYPVRPSDIYVGPGCLLSTFGASEIEDHAERLVRFFQRQGFWSGFRLEDLELFYKENGWKPDEALEGLAKPWYHDFSGWIDPARPYVVQDSAGTYFVTNLFIACCMEAADPTQFLAMVEEIESIIMKKLSSPPKTTH